MYIGKRVKELRQLKGLSLSELSEKSGVQIATLSRIEHLKMTGTLESHMNIAKALGVDITHLYTEIITSQDKVDLKKSPSATDLFVQSDKSSYEILTSKVSSKKMAPVLLKIEPGGRTNKEQDPIGSEKFLFILEGELTVDIDTASYDLSRNNTLYFDSSVQHCVMNRGKSTAVILCVTTPVNL